MKIQGQKLEPPKPIDIVIPRGDEEPIRFKAGAVLDYEEFEKACPVPAPPTVGKPGGKMLPDYKDATYLAAIDKWWDRKQGWLFLKSLSATPGLEWETLTLTDANTWSFETLVLELKASGFTVNETNLVLREVHKANAMDERHIEEVRKRFLQQEAPQQA